MDGKDMMPKDDTAKKITLKDIAERAEVSISTVSRALNQPEKVDEETMSRVNKVINDFNYTKPKKETTGSKKKISSGTIAVMVPDIYNPYFQQFVTVISKSLAKKNYLMLLCVHEHSSELVDKYCRELIRKKVDGCIISCMGPKSYSPWVKKLTEAMPVCVSQSAVPDVDTVDTYDEQGTYEMLELLIKQGHRKIGFLSDKATQTLFGRQDAYKKIHEDYNIPINPDYIICTNTELQTSFEQACRLMSLEDRPTAILCFCLSVAMGAYIAIRDVGLRIPEDISVVSLDDAEITRLFEPPISVVSQPADSIASATVDLVLARIKNGSTEKPKRIVFPTTLINRKSIAPNFEDK